jgi:hypothetical protein
MLRPDLPVHAFGASLTQQQSCRYMRRGQQQHAGHAGQRQHRHRRQQQRHPKQRQGRQDKGQGRAEQQGVMASLGAAGLLLRLSGMLIHARRYCRASCAGSMPT